MNSFFWSFSSPIFFKSSILRKALSSRNPMQFWYDWYRLGHFHHLLQSVTALQSDGAIPKELTSRRISEMDRGKLGYFCSKRLSGKSLKFSCDFVLPQGLLETYGRESCVPNCHAQPPTILRIQAVHVQHAANHIWRHIRWETWYG